MLPLTWSYASCVISTDRHQQRQQQQPAYRNVLLYCTWSYASCVISTDRGSWLPDITTHTVSSPEKPSKSVLQVTGGGGMWWGGVDG